MTTAEPRQQPGAPPPAGIKRIGELRRLIALVAPYQARLAFATVALFIGSGLGLVYPQAAKRAVDTGLETRSMAQLDVLVAVLLALFLVQALFTWLRHYLMSWLGERVVADLRGRVFEKLLRLPVSWFHERKSGEITGRLASDVTSIQGVVGGELSMALREVTTLIGGLVLLFLSDVELTLVMLCIVPPVVLVVLVYGKRIRKMRKAVQDRLAESSAQVQESIAAIQTVQSFTREPHDARMYMDRVESFFGESLRLASWRGSFMALVTFIGWAAVAVVIWLGARRVVAGEMSAGDLTAFLIYTSMVAFALGGIASLFSTLESAAGATARIFEILDEVPGIRSPASPTPLAARGSEGGSVRFEHVTFAYPARPEIPALHDVTLDIRAGEVIALVGRSGAGKTTMAALPMRFFDVTSGAVFVDGVNVKDARLDELRSRFAVVAQEPVLFSGTVAENIAYARPDAARADIERAAREAHAEEFIARFEKGYDTLIGERGVKLSGGQRQRIAIARAVLADPRVLILDEATSNLDAESEALVQQALARLMKGRTTLVIAHRLSTVRDADRIVVMERGKIVEVGPHDELVKRAGVYRTLVEHQLVAA